MWIFDQAALWQSSFGLWAEKWRRASRDEQCGNDQRGSQATAAVECAQRGDKGRSECSLGQCWAVAAMQA